MIVKAMRDEKEISYDDASFLISAKSTINAQDLAQFVHPYEIERFEILLENPLVYEMKLSSSEIIDHSKFCRNLESHSSIEHVGPDVLGEFCGLPVYPNDPDLSKQWYIDKLGVPLAWSKLSSEEYRNVIISILDSGVQLDAQGRLSHPDLSNSRILIKENCAEPGGTVADTLSHGTAMAGIICATPNNNIAISGINWNSDILIYKVCTSDNDLALSYLIKGIQKSLEYAQSVGKNIIINCSLGFTTSEPALVSMLNIMRDKNINNKGRWQALMCCSAGNYNDSEILVPAGYSSSYPGEVICVGAFTSDDQKQSSSNYGPGLTVVAPGEGIFTTKLGGGTRFSNATSPAAAITSGVLSLIWSRHPNYSSINLVNFIKEKCSKFADGWDPVSGYGRITALIDDDYYVVDLRIDPSQSGSAQVLNVNIYN